MALALPKVIKTNTDCLAPKLLFSHHSNKGQRDTTKKKNKKNYSKAFIRANFCIILNQVRLTKAAFACRLC